MFPTRRRLGSWHAFFFLCLCTIPASIAEVSFLGSGAADNAIKDEDSGATVRRFGGLRNILLDPWARPSLVKKGISVSRKLLEDPASTKTPGDETLKDKDTGKQVTGESKHDEKPQTEEEQAPPSTKPTSTPSAASAQQTNQGPPAGGGGSPESSSGKESTSVEGKGDTEHSPKGSPQPQEGTEDTGKPSDGGDQQPSPPSPTGENPSSSSDAGGVLPKKRAVGAQGGEGTKGVDGEGGENDKKVGAKETTDETTGGEDSTPGAVSKSGSGTGAPPKPASEEGEGGTDDRGSPTKGRAKEEGGGGNDSAAPGSDGKPTSEEGDGGTNGKSAPTRDAPKGASTGAGDEGGVGSDADGAGSGAKGPPEDTKGGGEPSGPNRSPTSEKDSEAPGKGEGKEPEAGRESPSERSSGERPAKEEGGEQTEGDKSGMSGEDEGVKKASPQAPTTGPPQDSKGRGESGTQWHDEVQTRASEFWVLMQDLLSPEGALLTVLVVPVMLLLAVIVCVVMGCRHRMGRRHGAGPKYRELELGGSGVASDVDLSTALGQGGSARRGRKVDPKEWDTEWDDDWDRDDEDNEGKRSAPSISVGAKARQKKGGPLVLGKKEGASKSTKSSVQSKVDDDGWEDWDA